MVFCFKPFLVPILLMQGALIIFPPLVQPQDLSGFISIDCGSSEMSNYIDQTRDIYISYLSDERFTESGENNEISQPYKEKKADEPQYWNVRSFPNGSRNCYTVKPTRDRGTKYLIRATFLYGNYDNIERPPTFDLYIGVDHWRTVIMDDSLTPIHYEIIHVLSSDHLHVCLVNTDKGTPFISILELRPLADEAYKSANGSSLILHNRYDFSSTDQQILRYKDDAYDRLWLSLGTNKWRPFLNPPLTDVNSINSNNNYKVPFTIMKTAYTTQNTSTGMRIEWSNVSSATEYYFYFHFAELEMLKPNETREFNIYINGQTSYRNLVPKYLSTNTVYSSRGRTANSDGGLIIWLNSTENSTLPPLLNAMEVYKLKTLSQQDTDQTDAEAILNIKSVYGLKKNWQGDPCAPDERFVWNGLECKYNISNNSFRIISLNLSSSGLNGEIASSIANLTRLKYLDLSYNNLNGEVPEFLAQLSSLIVLNLKGNNITGPVPDVLSQRSKNGQLLLSIDTNPNITYSLKPNGKNKKFVIPLIASLGGLLAILLLAVMGLVAVIWTLKRRSKQRKPTKDFKESNDEENESVFSKKQQFTYSEILKMTNNLERILGEGGFGKVYYGNLNGNKVAVKMLSPSSFQGHRQFHAELKLLLRVHHRNLTILVGYCNEDSHIGLIYEYMAMGNLRSHLSADGPIILSWEDRLRIAIDTAQGLEYLHNGCKPPIIHRDVKSTNILLNENFQAKLGDFGVSKIFSYDRDKQGVSGTLGVSTNVIGTPGYLDPEYYATRWLSEKSDVFSFGVVLLELITAQPALTKNSRENVHISQWVGSKLANGDIEHIVDPRLEGCFNINAAWKAIEIAMACVSRTSSNRPTMISVVIELKECLAAELTWNNNYNEIQSKDMVEMINHNLASEQLSSPPAR